MFDRGTTRVIVGLGNPGRKYAQTRHNIGFMVLDEVAKRTHASGTKNRFSAEITEARFDGDRLVLVKPQTFMNESGRAIREVRNWYKVKPSEILVIVDDLDQPFAQLRVRAKGGSGGHNGLKSIERELGTQEYPRLRVGIGRPAHETIDHVLSRFSPEQERNLPTVIGDAADGVEIWLRNDMLETMNRINGKG